jgi:hypothetical protein
MIILCTYLQYAIFRNNEVLKNTQPIHMLLLASDSHNNHILAV